MTSSAPAPPGLVAALAGRYTIERVLGHGGMATVYLAAEVKHRRRVALKVLRPEVAAIIGAERFLKEIETTASLQHPHILPLHDSGVVDGWTFYVMPFVEGESLRERLARERQLPIDDALRIVREVASALDYAHRHGVIHRDIKPENILMHDGSALVADFGIALAVQSAGGERMTQTGLSIGTPQYMSPEQAMGERTLDARTDVFSLGAVLYEMLAGDSPFSGPTAQAVATRLLTSTPEPLAMRRPTTPPTVDAAVRRALEKLPADRFATVAQFADALSDPTTTWTTRPTPQEAAASIRTWKATRLLAGGWMLVALTAIGVAAWAWRGWRGAEVRQAVRFDIPLGAGAQVVHLAVSPDGRQIAYIAESASVSRLYLRTLDGAARLVDGAEEPTSDGLAFSPDGRWLAFVAGDKLEKVPVGGGAPTAITALRSGGDGIAWPTDDMIVLGPRSAPGRGLLRVSASGGQLRLLTRPDTGARGDLHVSPQALPGGKYILLLSRRSGGMEGDFLAVAALATGKVTPLPIAGAPIGVVDGRLLYRDLGTQSLMSVGFDLARLRVTGEPTRVADPVEEAVVSPAGVLVTRARAVAQLQWVNADGTTGPLVLERAGAYRDPRLSPDGKRIAFGVLGRAGPEVVIHELETGTSSRLSTDARRPEWTPDGMRVLYRAFRIRTGLAWQPSDFSGSTQPLAVASNVADAAITEGVVAPDGRTLLYVTDGDLFTLPLDQESLGRRTPPQPFHVTSAYNCMPRFSPDGRWVAFQSDISGQAEVYVLPFPGPGGRHQVSARGGREPVWAPDGRLYYREGQKMYAATVTLAPAFTVVSRTLLFEGEYLADGNHPQYDVARDGRLVMLRPGGVPRAISVVVDWRPGR